VKRLVLPALALTLLAGCGAAAAAPRPPGALAPKVVHVTIRHSRFSPATFTYPEGTRVRFVVTNDDPIDHEFLLGDQARQDDHEHGTEMHHGERDGEISVPAGSTAETSMTFASTVLLGCHIPGHWAYGMRGLVTVTTGR
jgi:uncharacterized cupredoxin-like copper-binding protein